MAKYLILTNDELKDMYSIIYDYSKIYENLLLDIKEGYSSASEDTLKFLNNEFEKSSYFLEIISKKLKKE